MDSIYYLRTHNGLDVFRIGPDAVSLQENDFRHADWSLETSALPGGAVDRVHRFCAAEGLAPPDWSVMATRGF